MKVNDRVPKLGDRAAALRQWMRDPRAEHRACVRRFGWDLPEVRHRQWPFERRALRGV